jgi:hypothetical protein
MPLALLIVGVALAASAFNGTYKQLGTLFAGDFTGVGSFLPWIGAVVLVGMIGYIPKFQTPSRLFILLVLLAMFLANKGFFAQFQGALTNTSYSPPAAQKEPQFTGPAPIVITGSTGASPTSTMSSGAAGAVGSLLP